MRFLCLDRTDFGLGDVWSEGGHPVKPKGMGRCAKTTWSSDLLVASSASLCLVCFYETVLGINAKDQNFYHSSILMLDVQFLQMHLENKQNVMNSNLFLLHWSKMSKPNKTV